MATRAAWGRVGTACYVRTRGRRPCRRGASMSRKGIAILALGAAPGLLAGCVFVNGEAAVIGSGRVVEESREVEPFERLSLACAADAEVHVGEEPSVRLAAEDNILPLITTEVSGGTLRISGSGSYWTRHGVKLTVGTPRLTSVSLAGSGDVTIENVDADSFRVEVRGSGDVTASGRARRVEVLLMGSGDVDLAGLRAEEAEVSVLGSGDVDLYAARRLSCEIRGSGDVTYRGNPEEVHKSVFGSGDVTPAP
ncbi:MAG: DUF2807 domain-containing protein [Acidobacteria bacterium]|nr:MAG: DUF2807 domain-containing protein [Acidobacteriota bacterium]